MRGRRALAAVLVAALAAGMASAREDGTKGPPRKSEWGPGWADPSDVLAAEIAFARLAREKGQWTAFRATAAKGAQQFAPGPVRASEFLKGRKDPPVAMQWQPHAVWMACDGSFAVTRGAWQDGARAGWFVTVWQRQERGDYKWVLDQGGDLAAPEKAPEFLTAKVADCPKRRDEARSGDAKGRPERLPLPADWLNGQSGDETLVWNTQIAPDGARRFSARLRVDGALVEVTKAEVSGG